MSEEEVQYVKTVVSVEGGLTIEKLLETNNDFLRRGFSTEDGPQVILRSLETPTSWINDTFIDREANVILDKISRVERKIGYLSATIFAFLKENDRLEGNQVALTTVEQFYLIPLNFNGNHWILLNISVPKYVNYFYVTVYDSLKRGNNEEYYKGHRDVQTMVGWFMRNYPGIQAREVYYQLGISGQQDDLHNCGLWVIINIYNLANGKEFPWDASELRNRFEQTYAKELKKAKQLEETKQIEEAKQLEKVEKKSQSVKEAEKEPKRQPQILPGLEGKLQVVGRWLHEWIGPRMAPSGEEIVIESEARGKRKGGVEVGEVEKKQKKERGKLMHEGEPVAVDGGPLDHQDEEPLLNLPQNDWPLKVKLIEKEFIRGSGVKTESENTRRQVYLTRRFLEAAKKELESRYPLITSVIVAVLSNDAFKLMVLMDNEIYHSRESKDLPLKMRMTTKGLQLVERAAPKSPYWDTMKWSPSEVVVVAARYNCYYAVLALIKLYLDGRVVRGGVVTRDRPELVECDFDLYYQDGMALRLACQWGGYETVMILLKPLGWGLVAVEANRSKSYMSCALGYRPSKVRMIKGVGVEVFEECLRVLERRGREENVFREGLREGCMGELRRVVGMVRTQENKVRR